MSLGDLVPSTDLIPEDFLAAPANVDASFIADADGSSYVIFLRRNRRPPILQTAGTPP
jgi:hypothetical protein